MGSEEELCKIALTIAELGIAAPEYIALRLRIPLHRVRSALGLMETFGWVERIEQDNSACPCSKCPLRKICPIAQGKRTSGEVKVYRVRREIIEHCKRVLSNNRDK